MIAPLKIGNSVYLRDAQPIWISRSRENAPDAVIPAGSGGVVRRAPHLGTIGVQFPGWATLIVIDAENVSRRVPCAESASARDVSGGTK